MRKSLLPIGVLLFCGLFFIGCSERRPSPTPTFEKRNPIGKNTDSAKVTSLRGEANSKKGIHWIKGAFPPQVAGSFYPSDPKELMTAVSGFLDQAESKALLPKRDVVGVLSPHAGYRYSGRVAGESFQLVTGRKYSTVVLLALNHRQHSTKASVLHRPAYDTPLGSAKISISDVTHLIQTYPQLFTSDERLFSGEHSLEVQIPFVQVALPGAPIVPIIVAVDDDHRIDEIAKALFSSFGNQRDVLFVISSDLSHHFPYDVATKYDNKNLKLLEEWDIEKWKTSAARMREGMCGVKPVLTFARFFEQYESKHRQVTRLKYLNSGDTAGNKDSVVGYGALAFSVKKGIRDKTNMKSDFGPYGVEERRALMALAKESVRAAVAGEKSSLPNPDNGLLTKKGAAFVTLKKKGELRGCIGHVIARAPLYQCIADVAKAAAIADTRFSPVAQSELSELTFEISVLTEPTPIRPEDVVVGRDGLIMSNGYRSGLLLPQVPIEWGWDKQEFLSHTCRKAGLPTECWKEEGTEIKAFQAIVFGEEDL